MTVRSQNESGSEKRSPVQLVRYEELIPCYNAFIDTRTPGSDQKENFTIIGPGVSENPDQHVHIAEPHGFNIGAARQPPGCVNSQHSHETEEVFFVHKGTWSFDLGEHGDDARITLKPGDLISIPTHVFRGFENIGDDMGFLWAVLGRDDPGHVLWAPEVFKMAEKYGLVLLEDGSLIDTNEGDIVPADKKPMPVTTGEQIAKLKTFDEAQLRACCTFSEQSPSRNRKIIAEDGELDWPHGFEVIQTRLGEQESVGSYEFAGSEVLFVHDGELTIEAAGEDTIVRAGDTATIAPGSIRSFANKSSGDVDFLIVRGKL